MRIGKTRRLEEVASGNIATTPVGPEMFNGMETQR